jgi:hypothetical protein
LALLPASGFQSVQYRKIEFRIAELPQLIHSEIRNQNTPIPASLSEQFDILYWKFGNLDLKTGQKTLTLKMFEEKYNQELLALATEMKGKTIWAMVNALPEEERNNQNLINLLKQLDLFANVFWSLSHYKSAVKYLHKDLEDILNLELQENIKKMKESLKSELIPKTPEGTPPRYIEIENVTLAVKLDTVFECVLFSVSPEYRILIQKDDPQNEQDHTGVVTNIPENVTPKNKKTKKETEELNNKLNQAKKEKFSNPLRSNLVDIDDLYNCDEGNNSCNICHK